MSLDEKVSLFQRLKKTVSRSVLGIAPLAAISCAPNTECHGNDSLCDPGFYCEVNTCVEVQEDVPRANRDRIGGFEVYEGRTNSNGLLTMRVDGENVEIRVHEDGSGVDNFNVKLLSDDDYKAFTLKKSGYVQHFEVLSDFSRNTPGRADQLDFNVTDSNYRQFTMFEYEHDQNPQQVLALNAFLEDTEPTYNFVTCYTREQIRDNDEASLRALSTIISLGSGPAAPATLAALDKAVGNVAEIGWKIEDLVYDMQEAGVIGRVIPEAYDSYVPTNSLADAGKLVAHDIYEEIENGIDDDCNGVIDDVSTDPEGCVDSLPFSRYCSGTTTVTILNACGDFVDEIDCLAGTECEDGQCLEPAVTCTPNYAATCVGNDYYNVNSCGVVGTRIDNCNDSTEVCVEGIGCVYVPDDCTSHEDLVCRSGDMYWVDSCGDLEERAENCDMGCTSSGCIEATCTSHADQVCYSGDVYWVDSCGEREGRAENCDTGCEAGECIDDVLTGPYVDGIDLCLSTGMAGDVYFDSVRKYFDFDCGDWLEWGWDLQIRKFRHENGGDTWGEVWLEGGSEVIYRMNGHSYGEVTSSTVSSYLGRGEFEWNIAKSENGSCEFNREGEVYVSRADDGRYVKFRLLNVECPITTSCQEVEFRWEFLE